MYGHNFYYESVLVLFKVPLKRGAELHVDTKEAICAEIADIEIIQILAVYG